MAHSLLDSRAILYRGWGCMLCFHNLSACVCHGMGLAVALQA